MTLIATKAFRGGVPRYSTRLLQDNQAARAWNVRITSGRLDPILGPLLVSTPALVGDIRSMFHYRHFVDGVPADNWLVFPHDVDMAVSPLANDPRGVFYFTSEAFEPRVSNAAMAIAGAVYPDAWFALGVPSPTNAVTCVPSVGSAPAENRAYAYTFVTAWGEESGPSPASAVVNGNINGAWNLTGMQAAPPNAGNVTGAVADTPRFGHVQVTLDTVFGLAQYEGITFAGITGLTDLNGTHRIVSVDAANNRVVVALVTAQVFAAGGTWARESPLNITGMRKRIYRTAGSNPAFMFVAEIPVAQPNYNDTILQVNEVMESPGTLPPPKNLTCLRMLPNGCAVGLSGNELCFSEPYKIYSWPQSNRYSFSGVGVNITPAGNSVIVHTGGKPILFTGSDPEAMSPTIMETYAPTVSKRGVADVGGGSLYPSFDGLWLCNPGQVINLTKKLYRDKEWAKLNPATFEAAFYDGQYFAHFDAGDGTHRLLMIDIAEADSTVEVDDSVNALHRSELDGFLYVAKGNRIYRWDSDDNFRYESDWMSKDYQLPRPATFKFVQIFAEFDQVILPDTSMEEANEAEMLTPMMGGGQIGGLEFLMAEINGSLILPVPDQVSRRVQFTLFKEGEPFFTTLVEDSQPVSLPLGYKTELVSYQVAASVPTYSVAIASTIEELRLVAP